MSHVHNNIVEMRDLTKIYVEGDETRPVLRGVNADVHRGEFVALAGPSGSGKTTLLNIISGIDTPTGGEVMIDSVSITGLGERERTLFRREKIGFVFQFFNLIPTLSVGENLLLPLQLNGRDRRIASRERVVTNCSNKWDLEDRAGQLSGQAFGGREAARGDSPRARP